MSKTVLREIQKEDPSEWDNRLSCIVITPVPTYTPSFSESCSNVYYLPTHSITLKVNPSSFFSEYHRREQRIDGNYWVTSWKRVWKETLNVPNPTLFYLWSSVIELHKPLGLSCYPVIGIRRGTGRRQLSEIRVSRWTRSLYLGVSPLRFTPDGTVFVRNPTYSYTRTEPYFDWTPIRLRDRFL